MAIGTYAFAGSYNGEDFFTRTTGGYSLWWEGLPSGWIISTAPGVVTPGYWKSEDSTIAGTFAPVGTYTGTATMAPS